MPGFNGVQHAAAGLPGRQAEGPSCLLGWLCPALAMHSVAPGPAWTPCFAAGPACAARRQLPCFAAGTACKARWLRPQASLLVVGDLGYANSQTLPDLLKEAEGGGFDALLHVGDIAYDLQV